MDGRGRKPKTTPQDALFMTLVILKHYQTWDKHAVDFDLKAPTLEKIIMRVIDIASPALYEAFVTMPTMQELMDRGTTFAHYPYAKYATDVKFQPSHRPSGRFGEQKHYYSGKHKLYGLKIEASVSPQGLLVDMSPHEPGSVHDLTVFRNRHDLHVSALSKRHETHPAMWAVLVDLGYVGLSHTIRAIHPKKRPVRGTLDRADLDRNAAVASDRVIVENFFGRVCLLWKISLSTYVWDHKFFDGIQRLTFALTNFHLGLMPLREDDQHQYRSVLARYARMAEEKRTARAATQRRYVQRRAERLATDMLRSSFAARAPFMSPSGRR
ncbi:hypothetical protein AaE_015577 [Aphanomyces astaci]|uniref:DDE Tnp4 domain-containing protein n=1 Tax=Aphanomyces astaci TaxID=112090 RepID=A0A6A4Z2A1_APHAT|nr:hypothetical protein AaE_015577 [Aphanomyces astaci]